MSEWFDEDQNPKNDYFYIRDCPLCNAASSEEVFKIDGFSYHKCMSCESLYTKPYPRDGALDSLYSGELYQVYQDSLVAKGKTIRKELLDERKRSQVSSFVDLPIPALLDIGCGSGTFLDVCKGSGWAVEGVEPSASAANKVFEQYGIHVHCGEFDKIKLERKFDIVTFWGVLEHLSDPISAIRKAVRLLNENGIIVFEVPSADCFIGQYLMKYQFPPTRYIESGRHNIFFSRKAIEDIAHEFDLEIELMESNGLDIQTILLKEFNGDTTNKILNIQDILNDLLLGDHYRVFLRKRAKESL